MIGKNVSHYVAALALLLAAVLILFEVSFDPQFTLPGEETRPESAREERFLSCLRQRDRVIHERAFGEIDNPDVQKEFITAERENARRFCRERFPVRLETVRTPLRVTLFSLHFRFRD